MDDRSRNGIKTYSWGDKYWKVWHCMACYLNNFDGTQFYNFNKFLMVSPEDLLPCVQCRKSFGRFIKMPEYNIDIFLKSHSLPDFVYLIHNAVNRKLKKKQQGTEVLKDTCSSEIDSNYSGLNPILFWAWLQMIAFNFPSDIQIADYWSGSANGPFTFPNDSEQAIELRHRLKTYILFFDLLKNFINRDNPLYTKWTKAYIQNTPTPYTFSNRTNLLEWLFTVQHCAGYGKGSFISMMENLHPIRSYDIRTK